MVVSSPSPFIALAVFALAVFAQVAGIVVLCDDYVTATSVAVLAHCLPSLTQIIY